MRHFFWIGMANTEKRENLSLASLRVRLLTQSEHTVISSDGTLEKRKLLPSSNSWELKTKSIFQIQRGILEIIQFIHMEKHLDGPCDTFVKRNHSMALSQYIKRRHLVQTIFKFHREVKKCHFGNFSERAGMAVLC